MELKWMGSHRTAVEALIRCGNSYSQAVNLAGLMTDKVEISATELQVMEYILENEERRENMSQVAQRLNLNQSNFSKIVSQLVSKGLLAKYRTANNRKNIIIQPTGFAREVYMDYSQTAALAWKPIFDTLDEMGPEAEKDFIRIMNIFADNCNEARRRLCERDNEETEELELIKL